MNPQNVPNKGSFHMNADAFSSIPPKQPVALVDLVETASPEASRAFVAHATKLGKEVDGRSVLANETLVPMTIPDPNSIKPDNATRLMVVSEYPATQACLTVLEKRKASGAELSGDTVRTYAARPWSRLPLAMIQTIMKTRGLFGRTPVPSIGRGDGDGDGKEILETLVRGSAIHGELPEIGIEDARWTELALRAGDRPIWMLNFLSFRKTATYPGREADTTGSSATSGERAYARYSQGIFRPLTRVGAYIAWSARALAPLPDTNDADWNQIAIARYPSTAAMLTMLGDPDYKAAHVHREAGLGRTRLVATQPLAGV
jgi:hypothetical protein